MRFQEVFLFSDLRLRHLGKCECMFLYISYAEVKDLGHGKAFGGAHRRAQSAKAAFGHVDVKARGVYAFRRSVGGFSDLFNGADRFDLDTIHRADLRAFITYNTIVDFIVQAIAAIVRNRYHLMRILNGGNTFRVGKVIIIHDGDDPTFARCAKHMGKGQPQPLRQ